VARVRPVRATGSAADAPADAIVAGPGENVSPMYLRLSTCTDRTETVMREGRGSAFGPASAMVTDVHLG